MLEKLQVPASILGPRSTHCCVLKNSSLQRTLKIDHMSTPTNLVNARVYSLQLGSAQLNRADNVSHVSSQLRHFHLGANMFL